MPPIEEQSLEQKAVLWAFAGYDNYGTQRVNAAAEIDIRWEKGLRESITEEGTPIGIDVTAFVKQEIAVKSILRLGEKRDLQAVLDKLMEVTDYEEITDIKNREVQRTITLKKFHDKLPVIVT